MSSRNQQAVNSWTIIAYFFVLGVGFSSWATRIPDIASAASLNEAQLATALFVLAGGSLIGMPIAGFLGMRIGPYHSTMIFGALFAFSVSLPGHATEMWMLCAAAAGLAASPALHLTLVAALMLGLCAFSSSRLIKWQRNERVPQRNGDTDAPHNSAPLFARPSAAVLPFGLMALLGMFAEGSVTDWSAYFLNQILDAPTSTAAFAYSGFAIAIAIGRLCGDYILVRIGQQNLLLSAVLLASLGAATVTVSAQVAVGLIGFALMGLGLSTVVPSVYRLASNIDPSRATMNIAAVSTLGYFGFLVGPALIGYVAHLADLRWSMAVVLLALIVLGLISIVLRRSTRGLG